MYDERNHCTSCMQFFSMYSPTVEEVKARDSATQKSYKDYIHKNSVFPRVSNRSLKINIFESIMCRQLNIKRFFYSNNLIKLSRDLYDTKYYYWRIESPSMVPIVVWYRFDILSTRFFMHVKREYWRIWHVDHFIVKTHYLRSFRFDILDRYSFDRKVSNLYIYGKNYFSCMVMDLFRLILSLVMHLKYQLICTECQNHKRKWCLSLIFIWCLSLIFLWEY